MVYKNGLKYYTKTHHIQCEAIYDFWINRTHCITVRRQKIKEKKNAKTKQLRRTVIWMQIGSYPLYFVHLLTFLLSIWREGFRWWLWITQCYCCFCFDSFMSFIFFCFVNERLNVNLMKSYRCGTCAFWC